MHLQKPLKPQREIPLIKLAPSFYLFNISICPVDMNVYARTEYFPSMTLKDNQETKRCGRTDARTHTRTDGQHENNILAHKHSLRGYNKKIKEEGIL